MLVIFTVILLGLLVLGLPVAFSLGTAALPGRNRNRGWRDFSVCLLLWAEDLLWPRYRFWLTNLWMISC